MKQSRVTRSSRHKNRAGKLRKANTQPITIVDTNSVDIAIIDVVLKSLYYNSHIDTLHIDNEIYKNAKLDIPYIERERLWEVMLNSGLVNPVAGFGNAGKLKLSRTGYQLMAQFGGYQEYMDTIRNPKQPQAVIDTPVLEEAKGSESDCKELSDEDEMDNVEES